MLVRPPEECAHSSGGASLEAPAGGLAPGASPLTRGDLRIPRVSRLVLGARPDAGDSALEDSATPGRYIICEL